METPRKPLNKYSCSVPHYLSDIRNIYIKADRFPLMMLTVTNKENNKILTEWKWFETTVLAYISYFTAIGIKHKFHISLQVALCINFILPRIIKRRFFERQINKSLSDIQTYVQWNISYILQTLYLNANISPSFLRASCLVKEIFLPDLNSWKKGVHVSTSYIH